MSPSDPARLDAVLAEAARASGAPGAQAVLIRYGSVAWTGRYGVADLEVRSPVTDDTSFCLASLGKTLVAALALSLVEEGRLELDEPVSTLLGDEVPGTRVVTPRMLLSHTSGYPDLYDSPEVAALMAPDEDEPGSGAGFDPDRPFTWAILAPGILEPVDPAARWEYSNAGYIVLTEMLVRILGGAEALKTAWAELAARADTRLGDEVLTLDRSAVRHLAHGYDQRKDGTLVDPYAAHAPSGVPTDLFGLPFGDGLFAGTATGVATFLDGLFVRQTVLTPATLEQMTATTAQAAAAEAHDSDLTTYGLGTFRVSAPVGVWQGHRGTYAGFTTIGACSRELDATLVVLTNVSGEEHAARAVWTTLVGELVGDDVTGAGAAG
jgi:CubicO group peptidase (beta-lactamase class C family)